MSDIAIKVENLSKAYQLGQIGTGTVSRDIERWWVTKVRGKDDPFLKIGQTNDRTVKGDSDIVWSLKDINFEIKQGDAVGIIGRNGAGKSTLLKLLSRVTAPTTGNIKVKGRIASLLEVGTGFHPELSGRENIYLNGAILGMRKKEIDRKFEEIVDFSGVERYIDTPVKRYSSGMYVRLAFAVAAHLESEILIVDEVLAVGDAEFQKKCLGKMGDVSKGEGRTILFVSHNLASIKALCNKGILLQNGLLVANDQISNVIHQYSSGNTNSIGFRYINKEIKKTKIHITQSEIILNNLKTNKFVNGEKFQINCQFSGQKQVYFSVEFLIKDKNLEPIMFSPYSFLNKEKFKLKEDKNLSVTFQFDMPFLASGNYFIDIMVVEPGIQFYQYIENALSFEIEGNYFKETNWNFQQERNQSSILLMSKLSEVK